MVDTGLVSAQLGLSSTKHAQPDKATFSNKGGIAEQFVGQQLRAAQGASLDQSVFYWQRTGGRLGEIDYIIQHGDAIVPIEVKSGPTGSMKSLHQFMAEKGLTLAVRLYANQSSVEGVNVRTTLGQPVKYRLLSMPLYLAERVGDFLDQLL